MGEWFAEFFSALPDVGRALYEFGDPASEGRGWISLLIMALWLGPLGALPLYLAKVFHGKREWLSATLGIMGAGSLLWWLHGVIPHAWIQFTESNEALLEGTIIPASAGIDVSEDYRIDIASNLYGVITEGTVGLLMVGGIVVTLWVFLRIQRKYPKTMPADESKPEAGGYR